VSLSFAAPLASSSIVRIVFIVSLSIGSSPSQFSTAPSLVALPCLIIHMHVLALAYFLLPWQNSKLDKFRRRMSLAFSPRSRYKSSASNLYDSSPVSDVQLLDSRGSAFVVFGWLFGWAMRIRYDRGAGVQSGVWIKDVGVPLSRRACGVDRGRTEYEGSRRR